MLAVSFVERSIVSYVERRPFHRRWLSKRRSRLTTVSIANTPLFFDQSISASLIMAGAPNSVSCRRFFPALLYFPLRRAYHLPANIALSRPVTADARIEMDIDFGLE